MAEYQRYECENCEGAFAAHPSAQAADGYCSPACETVGRGLG
jgi:hypothetical protein